MLSIHLDESAPVAVAYGLRLRGVDVTTPADVALTGATDVLQLRFAHDAGR